MMNQMTQKRMNLTTCLRMNPMTYQMTFLMMNLILLRFHPMMTLILLSHCLLHLGCTRLPVGQTLNSTQCSPRWIDSKIGTGR